MKTWRVCLVALLAPGCVFSTLVDDLDGLDAGLGGARDAGGFFVPDALPGSSDASSFDALPWDALPWDALPWDAVSSDVGPPDAGLPSSEGWDEPPGVGQVFVASSLAFAEPDLGFDLDGRCRGGGDCIDRALNVLATSHGPFLAFNHAAGARLVLVELAGLSSPPRGSDLSLTVKLYTAIDADDPPVPSNDFVVPDGEAACCSFYIDARSTGGRPPQAIHRAPARLDRGALTTLTPTELTLYRWDGVAMPMRSVRMRGGLAETSTPTAMVLGAALPVAGLALLDDENCGDPLPVCPPDTPDRSGWEAVRARGLQPDVDLDGDGLETFSFAGGSVACFDGCGAACPIPALTADPASCRLDLGWPTGTPSRCRSSSSRPSWWASASPGRAT